MKTKTVATPLLRAAAVSAGLVSCSLAEPGPGPDVEPPDHTSSRVHLRGVVDVPQAEGQTLWLEVVTSAGKRRVDLPAEGPGPYPFHLTDADLDGLDAPDDTLSVVVYRDTPTTFGKTEVSLPVRASSVQIRPATFYRPASEVPTLEAVKSMPPAEPAQEGSKLDLQGVIVFDNRFGVPHRIGVSVRGKTGIVHRNFKPTASPFRFRIQDADASEGYPFTGEEVSVWAKIRFGIREDTALETTVTAPVKGDGIIIRPEPIEGPKRDALPLASRKLSIQGTIRRPSQGTPKSVQVVFSHSAGSVRRSLPNDQWPAVVDLTGPAFAELPMYAVMKTVMVSVLVETEEGERYGHTLDLPFEATDVVFEPVLPRVLDPSERPDRLQEPVYGNTKGSKYDRPARLPRAPK